MNKILRFAPLVVQLLLAPHAAWGAPPENVNALAETVRPILPSSGWKMSIIDDHVILERQAEIGLYNCLQLPRFGSDSERTAYLKSIVRNWKLVIALRLGARINGEMFKRMRKINWDAVDRVRKDKDDRAFMPDDEFWAKNSRYGYQELPIIDTGARSIYMKCQPEGAILPPSNQGEPRGSILVFWDKVVERECQGIVDAPGKKFSTYD